jgi:ATP-dependent exoDNAse (exonuclease V) beta subunit
MIELIRKKFDIFEDINFTFDPKLHKYTYDCETFISVTQYIQQFSKPFDQNYWSKKKAEEEGVTQEEITTRWKKLNDYANEIGTDTHDWIENYFNGVWKQLPTNLDVIHRINKFNKIYATHLYKLEPLKFETRIFSKKWKIAGMIDALFLYRGKIYILDYKTNKKFTTDDSLVYKEYLLPPFQNYYKTHLNEYSIQISLYALILKEYGFEIGGGYLVYIGPGDDDAVLHKCIDFTEILENYLNGDKTI